VLGYLARRIGELPAVLVLTYRDDELTREHPLQQLLGQASAAGRVRRLPLRRLSEQAVRQLGSASPVDARQVFAMTSGNPFFVAEVLAAGDGDRVPSTVADAVLGRVRRLDPATQDALEQLAVVPSRVERWLVDALVAGGLAALVAAEEHGLLTVSPASVASGTSSPGGRWRTRWRWRAGWRCTGGCSRRWSGAAMPTCRASSTTRPRPATPTRSSATGPQRPGTRPAPAPTVRRRPLPAGRPSPGAVRPG
jgi:hypothetical protein